MRCERCGESQAITDFPANEKLNHGIDPWCNDCHKAWEKMSGNDFDVEKVRHRRAYQRSYHAKKRDAESADKRQTARGSQRLTKKLIAELIPRKLTLAAIRRPAVYTELMMIWEAITETNVWMEFEDKILARSKAKSGKIIRRLSPQEYPEFAMAMDNVYIEGDADPYEALDYSSVEEGLGRLSQALLEIGYYESGTETETETE